MSNSNEYLIPDIIVGIGKKLLAASSVNEKHNYTIQLEAIQHFCATTIARSKNAKAHNPVKTKRVSHV